MVVLPYNLAAGIEKYQGVEFASARIDNASSAVSYRTVPRWWQISMKTRLLIGSFVLGLLVALSVGAVSWARYSAQAAELQRWGADPQNPPDLNDLELAKSQLSVPGDLTDEEMEAMVERLFAAEDWRWNKVKLSLLGQRVVPKLVAALDDPRMSTTEFPLRLSNSGQTPLHRVSLLLEPFGPPEAVKAYSSLASNEIPWVRSRAGEALGNIDTAECVKPVLSVLKDQEVMLRLMTIRGISTGIDSGRATPEFSEGVFSAVSEVPASISNRENGFGQELAQEATILALRINPDLAAEMLMPLLVQSSSESFVWRVLEAIDDQELVISPTLLTPLVDEMKRKLTNSEIPADTYQALLRTYGRHPDADVEAKIREDLESKDYWIADAAADSLMALRGIEDPTRYVLDLSSSEHSGQMTAPQKVYENVWSYDAEINNGGHTQFFANTPGKVCHETLAALREIGATNAAEILGNAMSAAGLESSEQEDLIAPDLQPKLVEKLEKYDEQYYESDDIYRLLKLHVLKHPQHFQRPIE